MMGAEMLQVNKSTDLGKEILQVYFQERKTNFHSSLPRPKQADVNTSRWGEGSLPGCTTSIGNKRPFCVEKEALFLLGTQPRRKLYSAERRGGTEQRPRPQVSKGEVPSRGPAHTVSSTSCRQEHPSVESCPLVIFPPTSAAEVTLPCVTKDQTLPALVISADI